MGAEFFCAGVALIVVLMSLIYFVLEIGQKQPDYKFAAILLATILTCSGFLFGFGMRGVFHISAPTPNLYIVITPTPQPTIVPTAKE